MTLKISILGDIMCEGPFLDAANRRLEMDFHPAFEGIKQLLEDSDLVIGNLETPLAGPKAGYTVTREMYSFNTPDLFADAVKDLGIDLVLTANNHCCDRGVAGIGATIQALDRKGIAHTGTYTSPEHAFPAILDVDGSRVAIVSCTASTNVNRLGFKPDVDHVNLMDEQVRSSASSSRANRAKLFVKNRVIGEYRTKLVKRMLGQQPTRAYADDALDVVRVEPYLSRIREQIAWGHSHADLVVVCPHMGGQFNVDPGAFSEYAMDALVDAGADAVVASHPHVVQRFERREGVPCFFSLGNVSMSMSTVYINMESLPQYGIVAHLYVEGGTIRQVSYSLIQIVEDDTGYVYASSLAERFDHAGTDERALLLRDANILARRVFGDAAPLAEIPREVFV